MCSHVLLAMSITQFQPLAQRPLCTPHVYTDTYSVPVYLDEPLWVSITGHQLSAEIAALFLLLETTISSLSLSEEQENRSNRKVTFENKSAKVVETLTQVKEMLKASHHEKEEEEEEDVQEYLRSTGLSLIFPRVELYLQEPDQQLTSVNSKHLDNYFAQLTALHNTVTMAQQLHDDIHTNGSHKYIAHQLAVLHQCVGSLGNPLAEYKKTIEDNFQSVKQCCTPSTDVLPRLTHNKQKWLTDLTSSLVELVTSFHPNLITNLHPVLQALHTHQ